MTDGQMWDETGLDGSVWPDLAGKRNPSSNQDDPDGFWAKVAASNKIWIKKTWFYTIFDANAWGMYPYFLKFPCTGQLGPHPQGGG